MSCGKRVGCRRQGPPFEKVLVAAEESVGRHLSLQDPNSEERLFGQLTDFSTETGQHKFTTLDGVEEWVSLEHRVFCWQSSINNERGPNPTYKNFPGNTEAVGWKVRVYWNQMGRWYTGFVRQFDHLTGEHQVHFCDGDIVKYRVKHEAVFWLHNEGAVARRRRESQNSFHEDSELSDRSNSDASRMEIDNAKTALNSGGRGGINPEGNLTPLANSLSGDARRSGEMTLRPRRPVIVDRIVEQTHHNHPGHSLKDSSIRIYWSRDNTYYKATIRHYIEATKKYRIEYDDERLHEVNLKRERFKWIGPKGTTAGYTTSMKKTMMQLGAENVRETTPGTKPTTSEQNFEVLRQPKECIGRKVYLYWEAAQDYYEAEVLAYDTNKHLHFLWYRDGELEWLDLEKETLCWGDTSREVRRFAAGLNEGESIPSGKAAVGWKVSVFWKDDVKFYDGCITKYDGSTGRHTVLYDDNDTEVLSLSSEKVIWKSAPTVVSDSTHLIDSDTEQRSHKSASNMKKSFPSPGTPNRKTGRSVAANSKNKRQRLPTEQSEEPLKTSLADSVASSSEVAKENKVQEETHNTTCPFVPLTSSLESEANAPPNPSTSSIKQEEKEFSSSCFQPPLMDPIVSSRGPSNMTGASGTKRLNEERDGGKQSTPDDEILELFHVKKIPKGPLGPLDETRVARLPRQFGGGAFHFRIKAGSNDDQSSPPLADPVRTKSDLDQILEFVMEHQSTGNRIGRVPSRLDLHSTMKVMSGEIPMLPDYPSKEIIQTTTAAVRRPLDSPFALYSQGSPNANSNYNRNRSKGRKKTGRLPSVKRKSLNASTGVFDLQKRALPYLTGNPGVKNEEKRPVSVNQLVSLPPPLAPQLTRIQSMPSKPSMDWMRLKTGIQKTGLSPVSKKLDTDCVSNSIHLSSLDLGYSQNMFNAAEKTKSSSGPQQPSPDAVCSIVEDHPAPEEESGSNIGGLEDEKGPLQRNEKLKFSKSGNLMSTSSETSPMNLPIS